MSKQHFCEADCNPFEQHGHARRARGIQFVKRSHSSKDVLYEVANLLSYDTNLYVTRSDFKSHLYSERSHLIPPSSFHHTSI